MCKTGSIDFLLLLKVVHFIPHQCLKLVSSFLFLCETCSSTI